MRMVDALIPVARATGIAMANGRHLGHTGRIGAYPEALAKAGLVGMAVCNGAPSGHWVAAFGGRDGRISTNPIAVGWPVEGEPPVVADFSTSTAPEGVIRVMRDRKAEAPEGYLRDADGQPTRDPNVLYAVPKGAIQPLGGALGYRGTALALFVEVLTTMLNGDHVDDRSRKGTDMTILAILPQSGFGSAHPRTVGSYPRVAAARSGTSRCRCRATASLPTARRRDRSASIDRPGKRWPAPPPARDWRCLPRDETR